MSTNGITSPTAVPSEAAHYEPYTGVFFLSVPAAQLDSKSIILDLHESLEQFQKSHSDLKIAFHESLKKAPAAAVELSSKGAETGSGATAAAEKKKEDEELIPKGRERYRDKVAELEQRVIAAGVVGDTSELDLEDSFIDDTDKSSVCLFCRECTFSRLCFLTHPL